MTGRPSIYSEALAQEICRRIVDGESLRAICADAGMPAKATVMTWLGRRPGFAASYARAREMSADADADDVKDIARRTLEGEVRPDVARVAIDALKWSAARRAPRKYGDKAASAGGEPGEPPSVAEGGRIDLSSLDPEQLRALASIRLPSE
jgi:terminase small subunit-like protein